MSQAQQFQEACGESYRRVYVWELPVRAFHWINAAAITVLILTGLYISFPISLVHSLEASHQNSVGLIRFMHFLSAYILVVNYAVRIYWSFVGNRFAHWRTFFPLTREQREEIVDVLKVDILQTKPSDHFFIGHNAMASLVYMVFSFVVLLQVITGFALYTSMSDAWLPAMFQWAWFLAGGEQNLRFIHHLTTWFFVLFVMVHLYLVFYHDYIEGRGTLSSIVGGWKFFKVKNIQRKDHH